jgi:rubredoxin|tara:strand:- start:1279 stop:1593 length:315 start_codon:yes stop_codon:yes gene_type:complete
MAKTEFDTVDFQAACPACDYDKVEHWITNDVSDRVNGKAARQFNVGDEVDNARAGQTLHLRELCPQCGEALATTAKITTKREIGKPGKVIALRDQPPRRSVPIA